MLNPQEAYDGLKAAGFREGLQKLLRRRLSQPALSDAVLATALHRADLARSGAVGKATADPWAPATAASAAAADATLRPGGAG